MFANGVYRQGSSWTFPSATSLTLLGLALLGGPLPAQGELYVKQDTLQKTMLATRDRLQQWETGQKNALRDIKIGPWFRAVTRNGEKLDPLAVSGTGLNLGTGKNPGGPSWSPCPADNGGNPAIDPARTDYLYTTLTAAGPTRLTIELSRHERYGGFAYRPPPCHAGVKPTDSLLWLNGKRVSLQNFLEGYQRVPVAKRRGLHDAVLVELPLERGENRLLVAPNKGPHSSWFTSVRLSPQPVPALWALIENDFPRDRHRLLEYVPYGWFEPEQGWFSEKGPELIQQLLTGLVDELGTEGDSVRGRRAKLVQAQVPLSDPRWLDLAVHAVELRASLRDLKALRAAMIELQGACQDRYPGRDFLERANRLQQRFQDRVSLVLDPADGESQKLFQDLRNLQYEALVAQNPLLQDQQLLFLKRPTYDSDHFYDEFNAGLRRFGSSLCLLSLKNRTVASIAPGLEAGLIDRYDLSFDGRRIVFNYKPPRPEGFRLYEIGVDGGGLRQLTFPPADEKDRMAAYATCSLAELERNPTRYGHWTDDMHPCYLPDGRIVFTSTRTERSVLCGGHGLTVTNLHRIHADGSGLHCLSQGALSEFCPTVMNDGRILYNRWEYVDKGAGAVQSLWAMVPDGSRSEAIYGNNTSVPPVYNQARHIPGKNNLVVCLGAGHCPGNMGAILLVDLHKDKRTPEAMTPLTPGSVPRGNWALRQFRNGRWITDIYGPWYSDPYPLTAEAYPALAGKFFLVSCNPAEMWNEPAAYGLFLLDVFGNRVPIYSDPKTSCWQARPLRARPVPPVLSDARPGTDLVDGGQWMVDGNNYRLPASGHRPPVTGSQSQNNHHQTPSTVHCPPSTVLVADVYQGLDGVTPGSVKYLRVMEQVPRPWSVYKGYRGDDSSPGQMVAVSLFTHLSIKVLHGIVPVQPDGSALFTVPARRNLFFQALDENFMEIQRMRTFVDFQPGEQRSCVGCHEHRNRAPATRRLLAMQSPPARLQPQPGEQGPRPLHYPTDIQPIFDRHCVSCHCPSKPGGNLDLTGELTALFSKSYENLIHKDLVFYIQEFIGPKPEGADAMGYAAAARPFTYGSHKSKLIAALRTKHYDVKLSREEFIRLATWVDANAPYYGSYFGRRNLAYRNQPDFRPVPTLESALGLRPALPDGPGDRRWKESLKP